MIYTPKKAEEKNTVNVKKKGAKGKQARQKKMTLKR